jgi:hypothetical protein
MKFTQDELADSVKKHQPATVYTFDATADEGATKKISVGFGQTIMCDDGQYIVTDKTGSSRATRKVRRRDNRGNTTMGDQRGDIQYQSICCRLATADEIAAWDVAQLAETAKRDEAAAKAMASDDFRMRD